MNPLSKDLWLLVVRGVNQILWSVNIRRVNTQYHQSFEVWSVGDVLCKPGEQFINYRPLVGYYTLPPVDPEDYQFIWIHDFTGRSASTYKIYSPYYYWSSPHLLRPS